GDLHVGTSTGTALATAPEGRATAEGATEEGLEQVAQAGAEGTAVEAAPGRTRHLGAEHVVAPPALRIAKGLVGLGDLLEPVFCHGVTAAGVRVQLPRQAPVGALDLVLSGAGADAEQLVVVGGHCYAL